MSMRRGSATISFAPRLRTARRSMVPKTGCCSVVFEPMMKNKLGIGGNIVHRVGHGTRTEGGRQTGHRAGVSETGAVVNVVRSDDLPRQFVHQVVFFVRAFGRSQHANRIRA